MITKAYFAGVAMATILNYYSPPTSWLAMIIIVLLNTITGHLFGGSKYDVLWDPRIWE
jgi:hypothetical protein